MDPFLFVYYSSTERFSKGWLGDIFLKNNPKKLLVSPLSTENLEETTDISDHYWWNNKNIAV